MISNTLKSFEHAMFEAGLPRRARQLEAVRKRHEKLIDDIVAACQIGSTERVMDLIEKELEE